MSRPTAFPAPPQIDPADCAHADEDLAFTGEWPAASPSTPYLHACRRCGTSVLRAYVVVDDGSRVPVMVEKDGEVARG